MTFYAIWVTIWSALHVLTFGLVCYHCLQTRREATSSILWILICWMLPVIGAFLYLTVGIDRVPQMGFHKHTHDAKLLEEREASQDELPLAYWRAVNSETVHGTAPAELATELGKIMDSISSEYPLLSGNTITNHVTGDELYPRMLEAIDQATHHIHLQSFIIQNDVIGRNFMDHLAAKAKSGVKVRLLYDRFGSTQAVLTGMFRRYRKTPNFSIAGWTQVSPLKRRFQINLRNHRKSLIVDGKVAFIGGINIHKENTTRSGKEPIRDYHFELTGPIVQEVQYSFIRDWFYITQENAKTLLRTACFPSIATTGNALARLICTGPTPKLQNITDVFFTAIVRAAKQILIVTPYFVPPNDILRALQSSAIRGLDIRLILPANNNHLYAGWASRALYDELMESGVRIFLRKDPFMHAKAMIIDDSTAIIGSANWDVRSLRLNYESNVVIHDEAFSNSIKRIVLDDEAQSNEIKLTEWRQRPTWHRLAENACSLMTPVL